MSAEAWRDRWQFHRPCWCGLDWAFDQGRWHGSDSIVCFASWQPPFSWRQKARVGGVRSWTNWTETGMEEGRSSHTHVRFIFLSRLHGCQTRKEHENLWPFGFQCWWSRRGWRTWHVLDCWWSTGWWNLSTVSRWQWWRCCYGGTVCGRSDRSSAEWCRPSCLLFLISGGTSPPDRTCQIQRILAREKRREKWGQERFWKRRRKRKVTSTEDS